MRLPISVVAGAKLAGLFVLVALGPWGATTRAGEPGAAGASSGATLPLGPEGGETTRDEAPTEAAAPQSDAPEVGIPPTEPPFLGLVLEDEVNLRAGPGTNYDIVARLRGGTRVSVLGESFGWYKIVANAPELKLYASKAFMETKSGEPVAAVVRDRVNIRARPAIDAGIVGQLQRGDLVRVLGAEGEWLAIAPPDDVLLFVHGDFVRPIGPIASAADPPPAVPDTPLEKLIKAREIYLAEIEKSDLAAMSFAEPIRLFGEALAEATDVETRYAALEGLRRARRAADLQTGPDSQAPPAPTEPTPMPMPMPMPSKTKNP